MTDGDPFEAAMNPDYRPPSFADAVGDALHARLTSADLIAARDALLAPTPWPLVYAWRLTPEETAAYVDAPTIEGD